MAQNKHTITKSTTRERQVDLNKIVSELKSERDRLGRAIAALVNEARGAVGARIAAVPGKRSKGITAAGRKRLSLAMKRRWAERRGKAAVPKAKGKAPAAAPKGRGLTPAGRKKLSEAMKRRWAEKKKAAS